MQILQQIYLRLSSKCLLVPGKREQALFKRSSTLLPTQLHISGSPSLTPATSLMSEKEQLLKKLSDAG